MGFGNRKKNNYNNKDYYVVSVWFGEYFRNVYFIDRKIEV